MSAHSSKGRFADPLLKALEDAGYEVVRRARNSHLVMEASSGRQPIIIPAKLDDVILAKKIAKIAGVHIALH